MPRRSIILTTLGLLTLAATHVGYRPAAHPLAAEPPEAPLLIAAPGRVEPISEEIEITAETSGKLSKMLVDEGDAISAGQVLAVLENRDRQARVAAAEAKLAITAAALERLVNGARGEERREAVAVVEETEAMLVSARTQWDRRKALLRDKAVSQEDVELAHRGFEVAQRRNRAAAERHALLIAPPRDEDRAKAEADIRLAQAQLEEARAELDKTTVRSPIDGVVLRRHHQAGEQLSDSPDQPLLTIANVSKLRIRAEIDETDVGRLRTGQQGWCTAAAYGDRRWTCRVVSIGRMLGKKKIRTDEPTERHDTKTLEALLELDEPVSMPIGLRLDVFLNAGGEQADMKE